MSLLMSFLRRWPPFSGPISLYLGQDPASCSSISRAGEHWSWMTAILRGESCSPRWVDMGETIRQERSGSFQKMQSETVR